MEKVWAKSMGWALVLVLMVAIPEIAAQKQKDVDVTRGQIWTNFILNAKLTESGFGGFFRYGSRYNYRFEKNVNSAVKDEEEQESWLNEFFIGPSYRTKIGPVNVFTSPQYRPMFWHLSEAKDADPDSYLENTLHWPTVFSYKLKPLTLRYRLILWNRFPTDYTVGGKDFETDNEFLTRHFLGVTVPLNKKLSFNFGDEIFWLHTADDPGEEALWRNAVWFDMTYKTPIKGLAAKLGYTNYLTFKDDSAASDIDVMDHYVTFALVYNMDFSGMWK